MDDLDRARRMNRVRQEEKTEADWLWQELYVRAQRDEVVTVSPQIFRSIAGEREGLKNQVQTLLRMVADMDKVEQRLRERIRELEAESK